MKLINTLMLAGTVLGLLACANSAQADAPWLAMSPKVKANRQTFALNSGIDQDTIHPQANNIAASPKVQALKLKYAPAGSSQNEPNLIQGIVYTGKNPFRDVRIQQFEIAPLK